MFVTAFVPLNVDILSHELFKSLHRTWRTKSLSCLFCLLLTHFLGDWSECKKLSEIMPPLAQHLQYLTDINATEELRCMKIICSIDHSCTICLKTYCAAPFAALVN